MLDDVNGRGIMPSPSLAEQELGQEYCTVYLVNIPLWGGGGGGEKWGVFFFF